MSWEVFGLANTDLGFISTVFTVLGIVWGVYVSGRHLSISKTKDRLGWISLDEELMGYFVTNVSHIWSFIPFWMPKQQPHSMLTVTSLIQAGDAGIFDSSMFDWMSPLYSRVSWMPFYEAFYRELAWTTDMRRPCMVGIRAAAWDMYNNDEFAKKTRLDVLKVKRELEGKMSYHWVLEYLDVSNRLRDSFRTNTSKWVLEYLNVSNRLHDSFWQRRKDHLKVPQWASQKISLHETKIKNIDPHLLYYGWTVRYDEKKQGTKSNEKKQDAKRDKEKQSAKMDVESVVESIPKTQDIPNPKKFEPLLIRSIKPLERIDTEIWSTTKKLDRTRLWIHDDKPCVQVFSEEMAALIFILGITYFEHYKAKTYSEHSEARTYSEPYEARNVTSAGAFGTVLTNRQVDHYNMVRLTHSRWGHQSHLGGGSGYSTIFAKHMACGCLPFSQSVTKHHKLNVIHTIVVTKMSKETLTTLQSEAVILYEQLPNSTLEVPASVWKYLRSLPGTAIPDLYYPYSRHGHDPDLSEFFNGMPKEKMEKEIESFAVYSKYDSDGPQPQKTKPATKVYTWPKAVAGIAFGGLVPMATNHLVDAVAFAVGEGPQRRMIRDKELRSKEFQKSSTGKELQKFVDLILAVQDHANHRVKVEHVPLFGEEEQSISWMMTDLGELDLDSYLFDKSRTTMDATWSLDQLTTTLEYLIAFSDLNSVKEKEKLDQRQGPELKMSMEEWKVHRAFQECATRVTRSMLQERAARVKESMLDRGKEPLHKHGAQHTEPTKIEEILEDVIQKMKPEAKEKLSPQDCGNVAWCIIKAWTVLVKKISWHEDGDGKAADEYRPPKLEELPLVSAWE